MEPIQLFNRIFYVHIYRYQIYCGVDLLTPGFKPHKWTAFWATLNASFFVFSMYTLVVYDQNTKWKCLTCLGIAIQGLVKYASVLYCAKQIFLKIHFLRSVYVMNADESTANYRSLAKYAKLSLFITIGGALLICSSCFAFIPLTLAENYLTHKRDPVLQAFLPFVDETTTAGYAILFIYHLFILFLAGSGSTAVDILLVILVTHLWPLCEIFQNMLTTLNELLLNRECRESVELQVYFRNFILVHKEFCSYLEGIAEIYSVIIFIEIYTSAISLCFTIFCLLTLNWFELYFMFTLMFMKLLVYCLLGTIAEMTTDSVNDALLQSRWNQLPLAQQRYLMLMVLRAQNPTILMAGTMPLNLDTFVNVMKSVYSVGMLLIESVG